MSKKPEANPKKKGDQVMYPVYQKRFMKLLETMKSSLYQLGKDPRIKATDKTIKKQLENGYMRADILEGVAEHLGLKKRAFLSKVCFSSDSVAEKTEELILKDYLSKIQNVKETK